MYYMFNQLIQAVLVLSEKNKDIYDVLNVKQNFFFLKTLQNLGINFSSVFH